MRLIDADAFKEYIKGGIDGFILPKDQAVKAIAVTKGFLKDIDEQPTVERPHGEWSGEPERRKMVTRVCTACGERSAVGYYCMWCGAYDGVSPRRDEKEGEKLENDRRGVPGIPEEK